MTSISDEVTITSQPAGSSVGLNPLAVNAAVANFTTDCVVAGQSVLNTSSGLASHVASSAVHGVTGAVVGTSNVQSLTNKTIDSASNSLTITGGPLTAANINNLINQELRTVSSPTFAGIFGSFMQSTGGVANISCLNGPININAFNELNLNSLTGNLVFIPNGSIARGIMSNTAFNLTIQLQCNNIVDQLGANNVNINGGQATNASNAQTFTNKTINSGTNALNISAAGNTNINFLVNQPVTSIASPTFNRLSLTGYTITGLTSFGTNLTATPLPTVGTAAIILIQTPIVSFSGASLFNLAAAGAASLVFTGSELTTFSISYSVSISCAAAVDVRTGISLVTPTLLNAGRAQSSISAGGTSTLSGIASAVFAPGDVVSFRVANVTNTTSITAVEFTASLTYLPL